MNISSISKYFTANRIAALATWLAGLAAFIIGVAHTFPEKWQGGALAGAGILTKLVTMLKYLDGSQKYDALVANSADNQASAIQMPPIEDTFADIYESNAATARFQSQLGTESADIAHGLAPTPVEPTR